MTAQRWKPLGAAAPGGGAVQPMTRWRGQAEEGDMATAGHLVIGLGGVGRRTIAELRRTLDRPYGSRRPHAVPVRYLVIDVEDSLQAPGTEPDLVTGEGGALLTLEMESARNLAFRLPDEVRSWLTRYDAATEIGSDAAANPRRLGSLLLAAKAPELQEWLREQTHMLVAGDQAATLQVHVVGYLAGGIGGGALTQLLVQLRHSSVIGGKSHLVVYGLLPGAADEEADRGEPAAAVNTGAALNELATGRQRSVPSADVKPTTSQLMRRLCDEILVIAPPSATGRGLRDIRTLPEALAMAVRQRLIIGHGAAALHPSQDSSQRRPIVAAAPMILTNARDEIEEALSISLLQYALYQLLYANWRHGRGFVAEAKRSDYAAYVKRSEVQSRWLLTVEHLIQSAPLLDADNVDRNWKLLADEWNVAIDGFLALAQTQPRKHWLDCVTQLWNQRYTQDFRRVGVAAFYRARQGLRRDMARTVRRRVEVQLIEEWERGETGLVDLLGILEALIALQRERLGTADERVANTRIAEESCRVRVLAAFQKWSRLPSWGWKKEEAKTLLHVYSINLQEMHVNMTRAEGWLFAKTLLPVVIEELESLRLQLDGLVRLVMKAARSVDLTLDGLSARMEEAGDGPAYVIRLVDHGQLRRLSQEMLLNERAQFANCEGVRQRVARRGANDAGFRGIARLLEESDWMATLSAVCREQVLGPNGAWTSAVREILDRSIYDALNAESGGEFGKLRDIAALLIDRAGSLLPETAEDGLPTRLYVLLPRDESQETFIRALKSAFSYSRRTDVEFVDCDDDLGTVHLLKVTAPFSISDVELLREMDRHYRSYVQRDRDHAMLALHAFGETAQSDFELDEAGPAVMLEALLLLGLALGLVVERAGGGSRLWLVPRDEHGFEDTPIALADDLLTVAVFGCNTTASLLEDNVMRALAAGSGDCERVIDNIVERVLDIRRRCNDDPLDPAYRSFVDAGKRAAVLLRQRWGRT